MSEGTSCVTRERERERERRKRSPNHEGINACQITSRFCKRLGRFTIQVKKIIHDNNLDFVEAIWQARN